jgi:hypothetical protein
MRRTFFFSLLLLDSLCEALNNGRGLLPEMGANTWYMLHSHLTNYQWTPPSYCASCDALDIARFMVASGLHALGYNMLNFDDCIVVGRDKATSELIPDPLAFPAGPLAVSQNLSALGFSMGWYTVRGNFTCASGPPPRLERPGSAGFEALDAATYKKWGVSYLKEDTCGPPETPYTVMRDALNATGAHTFLSMCEPGQGPETAPFGRQWGNAWRIDEDDGGLWRPIMDNVNMVAPLFPFSGCNEQHGNDGFGCGWNDMGLLMVGGGMTADQDASHMALWAITATKLLISVDPRKFSPHAMALVANPEVIDIDQDALKLQGQRVIPPTNATRSQEDYLRIRAWKAAHLAGGSYRAAGRGGELLASHNADAGAVPGTEQDELLAAGGRGEVWQRRLVGGQWALLFFNNGIPGAAPSAIACTGECWARMGWGSATVAVRDVLARTDNGTTSGGFTALVRTNATVLLRLSSAAGIM